MNKIREYAKAVLAVVGGLTPGLVIGVAALLGFHVDETVAALVVSVASPILAALGVAVGPANQPKAPKEISETPNELLATWLN